MTEPSSLEPDPTGDQPVTIGHRIIAALEVLICSDYPTQLALGTTFAALGYPPFAAGGDLNFAFVVGVSIADTVLLIGLVFLFLYAHGERPRDVLVGDRSPAREAMLGVPLILVALGIAVVVLLIGAVRRARSCTRSSTIRCRDCSSRRAMRGCSRWSW